jgi:integrase
LSEAELRLLLPWLRNFPLDIADALTLMLWTCCRGAEIVAMRAEEIDGDWWTIPREKLKMRRIDGITDLRVPLVGRAAEIVRRRIAEHPSGFLFPSRSKAGHIGQKALGVAIWTHRPDCESRPEWIRPRLPVSDWSAHDLRRTGRTLLASMGCPSEVAEAVLGHMQGGIVGTYNVHKYDAERLEWLTRLAERLESLAG